MKEDESILGAPLDMPDGPPPSPHKHAYKKHRRSPKKFVIIVLVLVVLGALGYVGWSWHAHRKATPAAPATPALAAATPTESDSSATDSPNTSSLQPFQSAQLHLGVSIPSDWKATEKDGGVTISSPGFTITNSDREQLKGSFTVYMRQGSRTTDGKYIGQGVAIKPTEKMAYAAPGNAQRKETQLTNFGAVTSDHFTFFMITGDYNLQKEGQLGGSYGREPDTYIIVGGFADSKRTDDLAFVNVPLEAYAKSRAYAQAIAILKSIKINS